MTPGAGSNGIAAGRLTGPTKGQRPNSRYRTVTKEKAEGATYTPLILADFVACQIVDAANISNSEIRILDPAVGDGELLLSLLAKLADRQTVPIVYGFDTDLEALAQAQRRIRTAFPNVRLHLEQVNFIEFVSKQASPDGNPSLFAPGQGHQQFDLIIANPPYIRTQVMGSNQSQLLSRAFGLSGRVDLYHAFLIGIAQILKPGGTAGIIISNRFMTTKSGVSVRTALRSRLRLRHIWDLGDTKLFKAAVLPAVILAEGRTGSAQGSSRFTSIYETKGLPSLRASDPISALAVSGVVAMPDGRRFLVRHGTLDSNGSAGDVWRIATPATDAWLATVATQTWGTFGNIGRIRVGVKTCADAVFIRRDWHTMPENERPELLTPVTTHHVGGRFCPIAPTGERLILYPHESVDGQCQPVDLSRYPKTRVYLEAHRATLESRRYVLEAGRRWYEIWVPQDPAVWDAPKLVFRDIAEQPTFWLDLEGTIVNGDCYWLAPARRGDEDLLWLAAAVGNSTFIEAFYDHRFNNKLYAGRRRFMTQYVEQFPLPCPTTDLAREIVTLAKAVYANVGSRSAILMEAKLDRMIFRAFGLRFKEISRQRNL
jgi:tRNA1(Val) A37 N6-methylase TrmN6